MIAAIFILLFMAICHLNAVINQMLKFMVINVVLKLLAYFAPTAVFGSFGDIL